MTIQTFTFTQHAGIINIHESRVRSCVSPLVSRGLVCPGVSGLGMDLQGRTILILRVLGNKKIWMNLKISTSSFFN